MDPNVEIGVLGGDCVFVRFEREERNGSNAGEQKKLFLKLVCSANQFAFDLAMLSKVIDISAIGRKTASSSLAASRPATKLSGRLSAAIRRQVVMKQARRSYASISVAGGTASVVVEDKIVRQVA